MERRLQAERIMCLVVPRKEGVWGPTGMERRPEAGATNEQEVVGGAGSLEKNTMNITALQSRRGVWSIQLPHEPLGQQRAHTCSGEQPSSGCASELLQHSGGCKRSWPEFLTCKVGEQL